MQGKLTENWRRQNTDVEPASELLKRIESEKAQLVKEKKIRNEKALPPVSVDDFQYTLPESWTWCRMLDICKLITDGTHHTPKYVDSGVPFLSVKDMSNGSLSFEGTRFISQEEHQELIKRCRPEFGDILLTKIGTTGVAININTHKEFSIFVSVALLKINSSLLNGKFLKYLINSPLVTAQSEEGTEGVGNKNLVLRKIKSFIISLPPLAEQEAIVARVEELMQKIEELEKQTAERIQLKQRLGAAALQALTAATDEELEQNWLFLKQHFQTMFDEAANVKKLRETILQLAVQGKLTATWRTQNPTTEPASELLKRIQAEKAQLVKEKKIRKEKPLDPISEDEVPYTLPEGWVWCRLGETIKLLSGNAFESRDFNEISGVKCLKITNAGVGSIVETEDYLPAEFEEKYSQFLVFEGDLIIALTRPYIADGMKVSICPPSYHNSLLNQRVAVVRTNPKHLYNKYVYLFLRTSYVLNLYKREFEDRGLQPNLKNSHINLLQFPLPPLPEQEAIVAKVEQLMQLCDELEQQLQQSKQEAEALMQAVVQEALQVQEEEVTM